uniref:Natural cytotoxicity triggering receptor 3 n=1 Tax=Chelonoidis abingdonii TaxID=106734 RepID=A0A8C0JEY3_CHEAB
FFPTPGFLCATPYPSACSLPQVGVILGDNATLNCTFSRGLPLDKGAVSWSRGGPGGEAAVPLRARFALAYPDTFLRRGEGTLAITNVSLEDAGKYVCRVLLWGTGEAQGNGTQLRVYGKGSCLHSLGKAAGSQAGVGAGAPYWGKAPCPFHCLHVYETFPRLSV